MSRKVKILIGRITFAHRQDSCVECSIRILQTGAMTDKKSSLTYSLKRCVLHYYLHSAIRIEKKENGNEKCSFL
jgi:hypothetical protein